MTRFFDVEVGQPFTFRGCAYEKKNNGQAVRTDNDAKQWMYFDAEIEVVAQAISMPDPPLKNPYMEGIEAIEGILERLQNFTKEFPKALDLTTVDDYTMNLLAVRDRLHDCRVEEMAGQAG